MVINHLLTGMILQVGIQSYYQRMSKGCRITETKSKVFRFHETILSFADWISRVIQPKSEKKKTLFFGAKSEAETKIHHPIYNPQNCVCFICNHFLRISKKKVPVIIPKKSLKKPSAKYRLLLPKNGGSKRFGQL